MLGRKGAGYHLEFTRKGGHRVGKAPTEDNLLVFYLPDANNWRQACASMLEAGFVEVLSFNPYWQQRGRTFEDYDHYRTVLEQAQWERS